MSTDQGLPTAETLPETSQALRTARERRADLHHVTVALEAALAAPASGRVHDWALRVHDALVDLGAAFERHIAATEGPGGLFGEVRTTAPRLLNSLQQLGTDHESIRQTIADHLIDVRAVIQDGDATGVAAVRNSLLEIIIDLARHRQQGADLVYEAYAVDIGVGD